MGLYLDDYARRWDAMLADIAIKAFDNRAAGTGRTQPAVGAGLAAARSARLRFDAQTQLSRPRGNRPGDSRGRGQSRRVGQRAAGFARFRGSQRADAAAERACQHSRRGVRQRSVWQTGRPVQTSRRAFQDIARLCGGRRWPSRPALEAIAAKIQLMYQNFNQVANAPNQGQVLLNQIAGGRRRRQAALRRSCRI